MKSLKYYLNKAYKEHWAIGQFNFSDVSQSEGIVQAANKLESPVILGTSQGESKFVGFNEAVAIRDALRKKTGLPIFLNLDHGKSFEYLKEAMEAGYDMVHFDGSKLELKENIEISKKVVAIAKKKGILVEGEVGKFSQTASVVYKEKFEAKEEDLTNPEEAQKYVQDTKVNLLAINVGTFHGVEAGGGSPHIKLKRLKEIGGLVSIPLVLHGGSGTPNQDIKDALKLGIAKININTEIRVAFSEALREALNTEKEEIIPYHYLPKAISAVAQIVEEKIKLFASVGKV